MLDGNTFGLSTVGVQLILGLNGVIWVSAESRQTPEQASSSLASEAQAALVRDVSKAERQAIARVANCIRALAKLYFSIHPASILSVYTVSSFSLSPCLQLNTKTHFSRTTSAYAASFIECCTSNSSCSVTLSYLSSKTRELRCAHQRLLMLMYRCISYTAELLFMQMPS